MIHTINKYIGRDMFRISLLATCAFTVIMTTFSVIEPLRKAGLGGSQVLNLFWYLAPVMMTLTLPIAMLFAATFVYGRFGMDNELTASNAGGISTRTLMMPAVIAGLIVGLATLILNNHIAPELARRGEMMVHRNLKGLIYQQLKTRSSVSLPSSSLMIHADDVDIENDILKGMVVLDFSDKDSISYFTASVAKVQFEQAEDQTNIYIVAANPTRGDSTDSSILELGHVVVGPEPLEKKPFRDKASFYRWGELLDILENPRKSYKVQQKLESLYGHLRSGYFASDAASIINDGRSYELRHSDGFRYVFSAAVAESAKKGKLVLHGDQSRQDDKYPVKISVYTRDNKLFRKMQCNHADFNVVTIDGNEGEKAKVSVVLHDVEISLSVGITDEIVRKSRYPVGLLELPVSVERALASVTLEQLYSQPEQFPVVDRKTDDLKEYIRDTLRPKVIAEINSRLAYGIGCILLVPIGAALGLRYRGGHVLSAFAISCVPAVILIVLMVMGQQMMTNKDANSSFGLAAIWSGVAILGGIMSWLGLTTLRN